MKQLNSIIYEPDYIIPNQELLTSLCLYYDKLVLYSDMPIDEELDKILYEKANGYEQKAFYIENILNALLQENIVEIYDNDSVSKLESPFLNYETGIEKIELSEDNNVLLTINPCLQHIKIVNSDKSYASSPLTVRRLLRVLNTEILSDALGIPKLMINRPLSQFDSMSKLSTEIADKMAVQSLCSIAIPTLSATSIDDIVFLRDNLKYELNEFKAGLLQLTYLIYKSIDIYSEQELKHEIDILINTKIKAAVFDIENRINRNNKDFMSRVVIKGSQLLLHGILFCKGFSSIPNVLNKGSDFLGALPKDITKNSPEEKIAGYLLKVNNFIYS